MSKFSRLLSKRDPEHLCSTSDMKREDEISDLNSVEVNISQIENDLQNWTIPKQDIKTIYKIGTFDFFQDYSIKTTEQTVSIDKDYETIQLLSGRAIREHRNKGYKYLHVGLVQVAVKPLFRLGIDVPVLLCLRDARHTNFNNSLLALAETNISNGPIYFNCYPNFTVGLLDPHILDVLTLTVMTKNLEFKENVKALAVIYRVSYKTMTTTVEPKTKLSSLRNETIIFEANMHTNVKIPKKLNWNEITQSGEWSLVEINPSKPIEMNDQVSNITEQSDGTVKINFSPKLSKSTRYSSMIKPPIMPPRNSLDELSLRLKGVDFTNTIPQPVYEEENSDKTSEYNPTRSEMDINELRNQL